jgi:magnesium transporter
MTEDYPEVAARLLERAPASETAAFLTALSPPAAAGALRALSPVAAAECCAAIADDVLAVIVAALPLDTATVVMRRIEPRRRSAVLALLPDAVQRPLLRLLAYDDGSAGAIADPLAFAVPEDASIADAERELHAAGDGSHVLPYVYVVTRDQRLVGVLDIAELLAAHATEPVSAVMRREVVALDAGADLATVAAHPGWRQFDALPVVDSAGRLLGAIRHKAVRQMDTAAAPSVVATLVGLSELYWAGLSGVLTSIAVSRDAQAPTEGPAAAPGTAGEPESGGRREGPDAS